MNDEVLATITTYNPDIELLKKNIEAIVPQVGKLVIYDNCSNNIDLIREAALIFKITLVENKENIGVAGPLHAGVILADDLGYEYILTLDHDSIAADNMVDELKKTIKYNGIPMAGAVLVDTRKEMSDIINREILQQDSFVQRLITSGTLADVKTILQTGNYLKALIIDWVDIEMCYRLADNNYKIMICSKAFLNHQIGYPESKRFFSRHIHTSNYSVFRLYHQARNMKYCWNKYKKNKDMIKEDKKYLRKLIIKLVLFEENKLKKLRSIRKGLKDAKAFYMQYGSKKNCEV